MRNEKTVRPGLYDFLAKQHSFPPDFPNILQMTRYSEINIRLEDNMEGEGDSKVREDVGYRKSEVWRELSLSHFYLQVQCQGLRASSRSRSIR
ncbi:hypothetical protein J6590_057502 [Homalodisca vitripennis]|nr:hypothetical protein J6590_057502 [Homalodisca vitripennis]